MQKTYNPKFTYVIPFRFKQDRIIPLRRILDWLSGFQDIEVLLVEQDRHSMISHLNLRATHIFIESKLPFNKSWAYNIALKRCNSSVVIFGDADVIMNPLELIESLKQLDGHECVIPSSNMIKLTPSESIQDFGNILTINREGVKSSHTDGIVIFKKESILKIGGWNEDLIGFGYQNKFQDMKIDSILKSLKLNYNTYHFSHTKEDNLPGIDQRNEKIMEHYKSADVNMLQSHINMVSSKIGMLNKYQ